MEHAEKTVAVCMCTHTSIAAIVEDESISASNKHHAILWSVLKGTIPIDEFEVFLQADANKKATNYRNLLCGFDYVRYGGSITELMA